MLFAILRWLFSLWLLSVTFVSLLLFSDALVRRWTRGRRSIFPRPPENSVQSTIFAVAFLPLTVPVLLLGAIVFVPYFWLYPERDMGHAFIFGTDEEKEARQEYIAILSRKPFGRRLAERLGLMQSTDPPRPTRDTDTV